MTQARGVTFARLVASTRRPSPKLATFVLPTCFVIEPQHLAQRGTQFERMVAMSRSVEQQVLEESECFGDLAQIDLCV